MKHLVIAEKPSVGRDIARVLHCNKKTNTYIEGTDYIVTWALGHLVTLADPEQYGEQYKTWNMDTLPMLPEHWKLVVIKQTGRQFHAVKELISGKMSLISSLQPMPAEKGNLWHAGSLTKPEIRSR